jgi:hypothetical protein
VSTPWASIASFLQLLNLILKLSYSIA